MTNPADAEREAAWQAWQETHEVAHAIEAHYAFIAGYAAARASAAPAPDAGEREGLGRIVYEAYIAYTVSSGWTTGENIPPWNSKPDEDKEFYRKMAEVVARALDAAAIAAQAE